MRFSTYILILLCASASLREAQSVGPPNIVLILADDLGYADIGCYGNTTNKTPHLDALSKGGVRFTDFHSNGPMCSPTRAALLTGLYQSRFGRRFESALSGARRDPGLPLAALTIAELLRDEAGYATGAFGKWHLGYEPPFLPTDHGFDEFRGLVSGDGDFHTHVDRSGNEDWWNDGKIAMEEGYTTDLLTHHAIDFISRHSGNSTRAQPASSTEGPDDRRTGDTAKPFFLYVPHLAIHFPWQGPEDPPHRAAGTAYHKDKWGIIPDRSNVRPHVTAMIESLDDSVGRIVATLKANKLTDNTLVIFTSDNGGYLSYPGGFENISDMGPLRGQKGQLYEGGHRVPTIVSWPGEIAPFVCRETAMSFDLFPTIARLARIPAGDLPALDGIDLGPLLFDRKPLAARRLFWRMGPNKAVRQGRYKLAILGNKPPELYDLGSDIGEETNLAPANPEIVARLTTSLTAWEQSVDQSAKSFK